MIPALTPVFGNALLLANAFVIAQDTGPQESPGILSFLPLIFGILCIYYLTMVLPERRKKVEEATLMRTLKKSDRVVTIGGIHGIVASIGEGDEPVVLKLDESGTARMKVNRSAIARIVNPKADEKSGKEK